MVKSQVNRLLALVGQEYDGQLHPCPRHKYYQNYRYFKEKQLELGI